MTRGRHFFLLLDFCEFAIPDWEDRDDLVSSMLLFFGGGQQHLYTHTQDDEDDLRRKSCTNFEYIGNSSDVCSEGDFNADKDLGRKIYTCNFQLTVQ